MHTAQACESHPCVRQLQPYKEAKLDMVVVREPAAMFKPGRPSVLPSHINALQTRKSQTSSYHSTDYIRSPSRAIKQLCHNPAGVRKLATVIIRRCKAPRTNGRLELQHVAHCTQSSLPGLKSVRHALQEREGAIYNPVCKPAKRCAQSC